MDGVPIRLAVETVASEGPTDSPLIRQLQSDWSKYTPTVLSVDPLLYSQHLFFIHQIYLALDGRDSLNKSGNMKSKSHYI